MREEMGDGRPSCRILLRLQVEKLTGLDYPIPCILQEEEKTILLIADNTANSELLYQKFELS